MNEITIKQACDFVKQGQVIAYPTEAVYGLGCDPLNEAAVHKILSMKQRSMAQGVILIASKWSQISCYVDTMPEPVLRKVLATWPGPMTWLVPKKSTVPNWISGDHDTLAVRVTNHPVAAALCDALSGPVVSTSANKHGQPPALSLQAVVDYFVDDVAGVVEGALGGQTQPTHIRDALTDKTIRK